MNFPVRLNSPKTGAPRAVQHAARQEERIPFGRSPNVARSPTAVTVEAGRDGSLSLHVDLTPLVRAGRNWGYRVVGQLLRDSSIEYIDPAKKGGPEMKVRPKAIARFAFDLESPTQADALQQIGAKYAVFSKRIQSSFRPEWEAIRLK